MQDDRRSDKPTNPRWFRIGLILALGLCAWLARVSPPRGSAALELDPSYQQALGVALSQGLRFGREIVFTSGPLAYFTASPFDPALYDAKLWLWEVLLGAALAGLLFARLVRRGSWIDIALGVLVLIVLPQPGDAGLFAMGLLAADLGLESIGGARLGSRLWRGTAAATALALLSILALVKVTSLALALAVVAILVARAAASSGRASALRWLAGWLLAQCALWLCIGQRLADLPAYFMSSIQLAAGFDSAMSLPPSSAALFLGISCLALILGLCAWQWRRGSGSAGQTGFSASRAQAVLVAVALLLAYKTGFARASDHVVTFFSTAMLAPMFLIPFERAPAAQSAWRSARLRCALTLFAVCGTLATLPAAVRSPSAIVAACARRVLQAGVWISRPNEVRETLLRSRAALAKQHDLPRIREIVGQDTVCAFTVGAGVIFLNELHWRPRPVMAAFSVFTRKTAQANADFLTDTHGPDFVLLYGGTIDRRLPSSEDPLSVQVLLRDFRPRANEGGFLLLKRMPALVVEPRQVLAQGDAGFDERVSVPRGGAPLVIQGRVRSSWRGRLRALVFQTPALQVEVEFESGARAPYRLAPFALECGVVLAPWLPTKEAWIAAARDKLEDPVVALRFESAGRSAFAERVEYEFQRADDLRGPALEGEVERSLVLAAIGELPREFGSREDPELVGWEGAPVMLLVHAPAQIFYAAGPGHSRLVARMDLPPWIADAPDFAGLIVTLSAHTADGVRELARVEVAPAGAGSTTRSFGIEAQAEFADAGDWWLEVRPRSEIHGAPAAIGIHDLRVER